MSKELKKIHKSAEEIIDSSVSEKHNSEAIQELYFMLGGADVMGTIADNLNSARIALYQRIRDDRSFEAEGYERFDVFMDTHPKSTLSYKRFNYLEGIIKKLGTQEFDLLNGSGLSMRQMKLLQAGDIAVDGNEVVIGGVERVDLGESRVVKQVVENLIREKIQAQNEADRSANDAEKLESQLERGKNEYDELRRNFDAISELSPLDRTLTDVVTRLAKLHKVIDSLTPEEKQEKGSIVMNELTAKWFAIRDAFGLKMGLDEPENGESFEDRAFAAIDSELGFDD